MNDLYLMVLFGTPFKKRTLSAGTDIECPGIQHFNVLIWGHLGTLNLQTPYIPPEAPLVSTPLSLQKQCFFQPNTPSMDGDLELQPTTNTMQPKTDVSPRCEMWSPLLIC